MSTANENDLSPNKLALLKIRELKKQLAAAQESDGEPIAVVSMACRFPRTSTTPEKFWQCLMDQTDEVSEIPSDRWDLEAFYAEDPDFPGKMYARQGVFLEQLDLMDPEFFGISPREATWVDPQQRLLMEVGWEALERAGWCPEKIGEHTGIFVGWMHNDYQNEASDSFLNLNPYIATGAAGSFLCGRLAYYLGLQGPSLAVDTACSSSLVALHLACQSLQRRDCDRALVGGVNAIVSPTTNILTCKLKALSPRGHSRAFDAEADGYLRGEGCGVVTLRRLSDAEQAGDPILGIIRGSAVGHNGMSSGLTAPNPQAQEKVIRQALERAGIDAGEVDYLEAHGTGTELGDPIEMQAAAAALAQKREPDRPLLVGSVKTNIGHLEAAAGMAGLIKVLLAMQHEQIPGQLNFQTPNPHIPWDKLDVQVLTEAADWHANGKQRIAGVSAFGMSGTNAHVVLEAPRRPETSAIPSTSAEEPSLIVLSGKNETAVEDLAGGYARHLEVHSDLALPDFAFTLGTARAHHEQRAAVVSQSRDQAIDQLKQLARQGSADSSYRAIGKRKPKVGWQFTGQGSQYVGMARGLYDAQPIFQEAIDHCDRRLQELRGQSLTEALFEHPDRIDHTSWTQPAIFAVQMGLAKLLQSWGLQPDIVLGHSVGQYAAACVAGIMSWDDGLLLISERGRLIGELPSGGKMLAVFAPSDQIEPALENHPNVSLAALNGTHVVVSGPVSAVESIEQLLSNRGVRTKALTTSHAFHSSLMDPALEPFRLAAERVEFQPGKLPLICNVTGDVVAADQVLNGAYWARHIREAVQFSKSIESVESMGCEVLLELGPQGVLTRMAAAKWSKPASQLITCLDKDTRDDQAILKALAQLYVHGATPDFDALYAGEPRRRVVLPTYPFQRRRFWGPDKPRAFHAEFHTAHPLLGSKVALAGVNGETRYEGYVEPDSPPWLPDHEVMQQVVLPGAAFVEIALEAAQLGPVTELTFEQPLRPTARTALQTILKDREDGSKSVEIYSSAAGEDAWARNFAATLSADKATKPERLDRTALEARCPESTSPAEFYHRLHEIGLTYGPTFQVVSSLRYSQEEVLAHLSMQGDIRGFNLAPTVLDGALHCLAVGLLHEAEDQLFLPVAIGRVELFHPVESDLWCHARWNQSEGKQRSADISLFTEDGQVVATIENLQVQQVSRAALRQLSGAGAERLIYELNWQPMKLPPVSTQSRHWLVVHADQAESSVAESIASHLSAQGHRVTQLSLGESEQLQQTSDSQYAISADQAEHWDQLLARMSDQSGPAEGIAWLCQSSTTGAQSSAGQLPPATRSECTSLLNLISALQRNDLSRLDCGLALVTNAAVACEPDEDVSPDQSQLWGLGRVLGAEQPELRVRVLDLPISQQQAAITSLAELLMTETTDSQFAVRQGQFFAARLKQARISRTAKQAWSVRAGASYLVTGGLGMLGRHAAKWLAEGGAEQIVLVSRRSPDTETQTFLDTIDAEVVVQSTDLSSSRRCREALPTIWQRS